MKRLRKVYGCPVELSLDLLGGKWQAVILARLKDQPLSYAELRHCIPNLSDKILTERLKALAARGLVRKARSARAPARVRYELTDRAAALSPALEALYGWGEQAAAELGLQIRSTMSAS